jgi:hypothetical protein
VYAPLQTIPYRSTCPSIGDVRQNLGGACIGMVRSPKANFPNLQVQRKLNMQRQSRATRGFKTGQTILLQTQENADEILLFLPLAPPGAPPASCSTSGEGASTASALHDGPRRSLTPNCHSRSSHPGVCSEQAAGAEELPLIRKTKLRRAAL